MAQQVFITVVQSSVWMRLAKLRKTVIRDSSVLRASILMARGPPNQQDLANGQLTISNGSSSPWPQEAHTRSPLEVRAAMVLLSGRPFCNSLQRNNLTLGTAYPSFQINFQSQVWSVCVFSADPLNCLYACFTMKEPLTERENISLSSPASCLGGAIRAVILAHYCISNSWANLSVSQVPCVWSARSQIFRFLSEARAGR